MGLRIPQQCDMSGGLPPDSILHFARQDEH